MSQNTGQQIGIVGFDGAPSRGNRGADAIKSLTPANTRPLSLSPGCALVGTSHNYGTAVLGAIPQSGQTNLSLGAPPAQTLPWNFTTGDLASFAADGRLIDSGLSIATITALLANAQIKIATTQLTSAQIKAQHTAPIELVAAPGANKVITPHVVYINYTFGTVAYAGADVSIRIDWNTNAAAASQALGAFWSATASLDIALPLFLNSIEAHVTGINQSLVLTCNNDLTNGDGTAEVVTLYSITSV